MGKERRPRCPTCVELGRKAPRPAMADPDPDGVYRCDRCTQRKDWVELRRAAKRGQRQAAADGRSSSKDLSTEDPIEAVTRFAMTGDFTRPSERTKLRSMLLCTLFKGFDHNRAKVANELINGMAADAAHSRGETPEARQNILFAELRADRIARAEAQEALLGDEEDDEEEGQTRPLDPILVSVPQ